MTMERHAVTFFMRSLLPKLAQSDKLSGLIRTLFNHFSNLSHGFGSYRQSEHPRKKSLAKLSADGVGPVGVHRRRPVGPSVLSGLALDVCGCVGQSGKLVSGLSKNKEIGPDHAVRDFPNAAD
jgi:hypothetical protein